MNCRRTAVLLLALTFFLTAVVVSEASDQSPLKLTKEGRVQLIRGLEAERLFVRTLFPMGRTGLTVKNGKIVAPREAELQQLLADFGPSLKPGDAGMISNIIFKGDTIRFEINGGAAKKKKWYQHIEVGGMGGTVPIAPTDPNVNPRGSYVDLVFDKFVPELTTQQIKELLTPVFDFSAHTASEAYIATLPPKVRDAIKNHQVLVGMDRDMVLASKGRPPKKIREGDGKGEYEEWIYGDPPQDVDFVRLSGNEVVRVETMKVDGEKLVRTAKEVDMKPPATATAEAQQPLPKPSQRPSLRRPGEETTDGQQDPSAPNIALPPTNPTGTSGPPSSGPSPYNYGAQGEPAAQGNPAGAL